MKIQYFQDTDTLYIELKPAEVSETKDLDEDTLLDLDRNGNICGITIEHAKSSETKNSDEDTLLGHPR